MGYTGSREAFYPAAGGMGETTAGASAHAHFYGSRRPRRGNGASGWIGDPSANRDARSGSRSLGR